jgi:hypothetical protein
LKSNKKKANLVTKGVLFSTILIFMVFLYPLLLIADESIHNKAQCETFKIELSGSGAQSLDYGYYLYSNNYVRYRIRWSFESSNSQVGITVLVMNHDEYNKYKASQTASFYTLSDGTHTSDSGTFEVPAEDYWVIMLMNVDPDHQQTYLTYEISIEQINPIPIIITVIIVVVVVAVIVTTVLLVVKKRKPKYMFNQSMSPSQPNTYNSYTQKSEEKGISNVSNPSESKWSWLFCPYCGEKNNIGAHYCVNCGKELKNQMI